MPPTKFENMAFENSVYFGALKGAKGEKTSLNFSEKDAEAALISSVSVVAVEY